MKKYVFMILGLVLSLSIYGQTGTSTSSTNMKKLYKGIYSGMSESEYNTYCRSTDGFVEIKNSVYETNIEGREYDMIPLFNKEKKLYFLSFLSQDKFEWIDYDVNIRENAVELFTIMEAKYGEPIINEWKSWSEIPQGKSKLVCFFEKGLLNIGINVANEDDKYLVSLSFYDRYYRDKEDNKSSDF